MKTSLAGGRKEDLLSQWYTSLPSQALAGQGSRKLHLGAMKYLMQVRVFLLLVVVVFRGGEHMLKVLYVRFFVSAAMI